MIDKMMFEKTLIEPMNFWSNKSKREVRKLMGEQVSMMVDYNQRNPHHCFELFQHSLHTVESLYDEASIGLRIAAFFHDIGKPYVSKEKDGRLVFYGHAKKSAEIAREVLRDLQYDTAVIARISFLLSTMMISYHGFFQRNCMIVRIHIWLKLHHITLAHIL